ncbi:hypothetical protein [Kitasatospora sp. LaBMicrA B282]|uniref:hypothetical protein n=1 Tax=Kitasatospora sp. LaBMicrA B282 TaxID=3420949 RepID=UPI003D0C67EC
MPVFSPIRIAATCALVVLGVTACGAGGGGAKPAAAPVRASASAASSAGASGSTAGTDRASMSGNEILQQAFDNLKSLGSLTVDMNGVQDGQPFQGHISLDTKGECRGAVGMGAKGSVDILRTTQTLYLRPDATMAASIAGGSAGAQIVNGRWMTGFPDDSDEVKGLTEFCTLAQFTAQFTDVQNNATNGGADTVNGQPVVVVNYTDTDGSRNEVWVASQGTPWLLKASTQQDNGDGATIVFSAFNAPVDATPPAANDIFDASKLPGV